MFLPESQGTGYHDDGQNDYGGRLVVQEEGKDSHKGQDEYYRTFELCPEKRGKTVSSPRFYEVGSILIKSLSRFLGSQALSCGL